MTYSSFTESFLLVFIGGYFFFSIFLRAFWNVLSQVPQKQWIQLLNPKNDLTLWDEYTHDKAVALKASLQFSSEDVSFLTARLQAPLNIPSQIPQRQSFQTGPCSVNFYCLKWKHKPESSFLERYFLGLISGYFTFCHSLQCAGKYHFFTFTGTMFKHCLMRKEVKFPAWNVHITKHFSENFSPVVCVCVCVC